MNNFELENVTENQTIPIDNNNAGNHDNTKEFPHKDGNNDDNKCRSNQNHEQDASDLVSDFISSLLVDLHEYSCKSQSGQNKYDNQQNDNNINTQTTIDNTIGHHKRYQPKCMCVVSAYILYILQ